MLLHGYATLNIGYPAEGQGVTNHIAAAQEMLLYRQGTIAGFIRKSDILNKRFLK